MTSSETSTEARRLPTVWPERLSFAAVTLLGWLLILNIHRWHFTWSVYFLWSGWLAMVVTAKLMWAAFWSAASEDDGEQDALLGVLDESRRGDLLREKKALLRSIKDVEFDRDMGKMSDSEAGDILRVYRARAIEIIKELDAFDRRDEGVSVADAIERELELRVGARRAPGKVSAARAQAIEEADRKDAPIFQMLGGVFLAGLGLFVTLATYENAAGGGMYVVWFGPIAGGIALFVRGLIEYGKLKDASKAAPRGSAGGEPEEKSK